MRASCDSLKLASTQAWSSGITVMSGVPAAMRWPTWMARRATVPEVGVTISQRRRARKASRTVAAARSTLGCPATVSPSVSTRWVPA